MSEFKHGERWTMSMEGGSEGRMEGASNLVALHVYPVSAAMPHIMFELSAEYDVAWTLIPKVKFRRNCWLMAGLRTQLWRQIVCSTSCRTSLASFSTKNFLQTLHLGLQLYSQHISSLSFLSYPHVDLNTAISCFQICWNTSTELSPKLLQNHRQLLYLQVTS